MAAVHEPSEEAQRLHADGAVQTRVAETEQARAVVRQVQIALQRPGDNTGPP